MPVSRSWRSAQASLLEPFAFEFRVSRSGRLSGCCTTKDSAGNEEAEQRAAIRIGYVSVRASSEIRKRAMMSWFVGEV
jgi:hypothetical protein